MRTKLKWAVMIITLIFIGLQFTMENENKEVLSRYPKIPGYPHLFVLDGNGKLLHSQRTFLLHSDGHHIRQR